MSAARVLALLLVLAACGRRTHPAGRPSIGASDAERVTVEVLNASGRTGLARQATLALRNAGIDVLSYGTADTALDSTLILIRRGTRTGPGERVARALGGGVVRQTPDTLRRVDVSVMLGRDWMPPPGLRP